MADDGRGTGEGWLVKALAIATALSPVVVIVVANLFSSASAKRDANLRLTETAVRILQDSVTPESKGLREWAVKVIDKASDVSLSHTAANALRNSTRLPPPNVIAHWSPDGRLLGLDFMARPVVKCVRNVCDTTWIPFSPGDSFALPELRWRER